jgi:hypothetical protein
VRNRVPPPRLYSVRISTTSRRPIGSRPDSGSSRISSRGWMHSAWAIATRCVIPLEKERIALPATCARPRRSSQFRQWLCGALTCTRCSRMPIAEDFERRQIVVEIGVLGNIAQAPASLRLCTEVPKMLRAAARRPDQPHQDLDRRRLAGAIGADEAKGLARLDGQRHAAESDHRRRPPLSRIFFFQIIDGNRGQHHWVLESVAFNIGQPDASRPKPYPSGSLGSSAIKPLLTRSCSFSTSPAVTLAKKRDGTLQGRQIAQPPGPDLQVVAESPRRRACGHRLDHSRRIGGLVALLDPQGSDILQGPLVLLVLTRGTPLSSHCAPVAGSLRK